jgi:hypothetical protein
MQLPSAKATLLQRWTFKDAVATRLKPKPSMRCRAFIQRPEAVAIGARAADKQLGSILMT